MEPQETPQQSTPTPEPPTASWEKYIGHIVRWEDGTTWFVLRDGRHWISDGETYGKLIETKAQVFNLPAPELSSIPDIKDSQISISKK